MSLSLVSCCRMSMACVACFRPLVDVGYLLCFIEKYLIAATRNRPLKNSNLPRSSPHHNLWRITRLRNCSVLSRSNYWWQANLYDLSKLTHYLYISLTIKATWQIHLARTIWGGNSVLFDLRLLVTPPTIWNRYYDTDRSLRCVYINIFSHVIHLWLTKGWTVATVTTPTRIVTFLIEW